MIVTAAGGTQVCSCTQTFVSRWHLCRSCHSCASALPVEHGTQTTTTLRGGTFSPLLCDYLPLSFVHLLLPAFLPLFLLRLPSLFPVKAIRNEGTRKAAEGRKELHSFTHHCSPQAIKQTNKRAPWLLCVSTCSASICAFERFTCPAHLWKQVGRDSQREATKRHQRSFLIISNSVSERFPHSLYKLCTVATASHLHPLASHSDDSTPKQRRNTEGRGQATTWRAICSLYSRRF